MLENFFNVGLKYEYEISWCFNGLAESKNLVKVKEILVPQIDSVVLHASLNIFVHELRIL